MHGSQSRLERLTHLPGLKPLLWHFAKRLIAGEEVEDALNQTAHFNASGFTVILNYIGEDNQSYGAVKTAEEKYLEILSLLKRRDLKAEISFQLSQFELEANHYSKYYWYENCPEEIILVLETADQSAVRVWLDAKLLETREDLWNLAEFALAEMKISFLGATCQAYGNAGFNSIFFFRNRIAPLVYSLQKGKTLGLRLDKEAYSSEKWILRDPNAIRERYLELARSMLELVLTNRARENAGIFFPEFATHNLKLVNEIKLLAKRLGLAKRWFRFAMPYGRQQSLASHLFAEGYTVAVYLPFGPDWLPYSIRRLQNNKLYIFWPFLREGEYHLCPEWPDKCILLNK